MGLTTTTSWGLKLFLFVLASFSLVQAGVESSELRRSATTNRCSSVGHINEDRLLFWSSYDFNIDAATQLLGPLDLFLRGGAVEADADAEEHCVTLEEEEEESFASLEEESIESDESYPPTTPNTTETTKEALQIARGGRQGRGKALAPLEYTLFQPGDGSETDPDGIPTRFIKMHSGKRDLAKQALAATLEWRQEQKIDQILNTPQLKFDLAKAVFPHYFLGRDMDDHVVFLQHPARLDLERARKNDLKEDDLLMHYVFVNEYLWQVMEKSSPLATMTSIIDLQGLHLGVLRQTDIIFFIKKFVSTMDSYYPQRAHKTMLLNAPKWFNAIYKLLKPLMRETTRSKIAIYTRGKAQDEALNQYLGADAVKALPESFWSRWNPPKKKRQWRKQHQAESEEDDEDDDDNFEIIVPPKSQLEEDLRAFVSCRECPKICRVFS
jgi:hypothetical protein